MFNLKWSSRFKFFVYQGELAASSQNVFKSLFGILLKTRAISEIVAIFDYNLVAVTSVIIVLD